MIISRCKQKEELKLIMEMQQQFEIYEKHKDKDNIKISIELLTQLVQTQMLISENLKCANNTNQVQILSINDTANAIEIYIEKISENICDWILEVERISNHAQNFFPDIS